MNSKGFMALVNIFVIILGFLAIAAFMIVLFVDEVKDEINPFKDKQIIEARAESDANLDLLNLLRGEASGEEIKVSDLINFWYFDRNLEDKLKMNVEYILKNTYGHCYGFSIYEGDSEIFSSGLNIGKSSSDVEFPLEDGNILNVKLDLTTYYKNPGECIT